MEARVILSATTLRGLAHPLRVRILGLLREEGPATASQLAARLGQSSGSTSYHLRQLATYGFIQDAPDRNVGKERWWQAAHRRTTLETMDGAPAETEAYLRAIAAQYADRVDRWLGDLPALPASWMDTWTLSDWPLRLTPAETTELHDEIFALMARYRRDDGDGPPGAERVFVQVQLLPFPAQEQEQEQ